MHDAAAVGDQAIVSRTSPLTFTASLGKQTFTVPLPAPMYWQTRHQQARVIRGSALIE
jgi:hypothetical protein